MAPVPTSEPLPPGSAPSTSSSSESDPATLTSRAPMPQTPQLSARQTSPARAAAAAKAASPRGWQADSPLPGRRLRRKMAPRKAGPPRLLPPPGRLNCSCPRADQPRGRGHCARQSNVPGIPPGHSYLAWWLSMGLGPAAPAGRQGGTKRPPRAGGRAAWAEGAPDRRQLCGRPRSCRGAPSGGNPSPNPQRPKL